MCLFEVLFDLMVLGTFYDILLYFGEKGVVYVRLKVLNSRPS